MRNIRLLTFALMSLFIMASCSDDDSFTLSTSNILTFGTDTVMMDTVFSKVPTPTKKFWIYNESGDGIRCVNVRLQNGNQTGYRVNVDGVYLSPEMGFQTSDVEIRDNDSICVFVELTAPLNGKEYPQLHEDELVFMLESGVVQKVNLRAYTWDAEFINNLRIKNDTLISGGKPKIVYGGITVDSLATLRIAPGTTLYFHANAGIDVYGQLLCEGTPENNIVLRGDRMDNMFDYLPYDLVSGQWKGLYFHSSSYDNLIQHTDIHSTFDGIVCDSSDVTRQKLALYNSTVHNCQGYGLKAVSSIVDVRNCQISNTLNDCVAVFGGGILLQHCTLAQFYPFDSRRGAALSFTNFYGDYPCPLYQLDCINSIVTGYSDDVIMGSQKDTAADFSYRFINSILRTPEITDSTRMFNVKWEDVEDTTSVSGHKHFKLVDIDTQHYDFHLDSVSTAIDSAFVDYALPTDHDGRSRDEHPDVGCYEFFKE